MNVSIKVIEALFNNHPFIIYLFTFLAFFRYARACVRTGSYAPDTLHGKRLKNHVIRIVDVMDAVFCKTECYRETNCVSYNMKKAASENGKYQCELNNSTFEGQKNKLETKLEYLYRGAKALVQFP